MISRRDFVGVGAASLAGAVLVGKAKWVADSKPSCAGLATTINPADHIPYFKTVDLTEDIVQYMRTPLQYSKSYLSIYQRMGSDGCREALLLRPYGVRVKDPRDQSIHAKWAKVLEDIDQKHKIVAVLGPLVSSVTIPVYADGYDPMQEFARAAMGKSYDPPRIIGEEFLIVSYLATESDVDFENRPYNRYAINEGSRVEDFESLV